MKKSTELPGEELEYNDGLGDMLREKEKLVFSWPKTTMVIIMVLTVVFIGATVLFKIGEKSLTQPDTMALQSHEGADSDAVTDQERITLDDKALAAKPNATPSAPKTSRIKAFSLVQANDKVLMHKNKSLKIYPDKKVAPKAITRKGTKSVSKAPHPYKVIVGSFTKQSHSQKLRVSLNKLGIPSFIWKTKLKGQDTYMFRVQTGAFKSRLKAKAHQEILRRKGYQSFVLVVR